MELPPLYAFGFAVGTTLVLLAVFRLGRKLLAPATSVGKSFAESNAARHLLDVGQVRLAAGSHYVATGIVAAHALAGSKLRDVGLSLFFFVMAMAALWAFVTLFRALTTYDDAEQIHGENLAASISYSGLSIGVAIIVGCALDGDFVSWETSLKGFGATPASVPSATRASARSRR